MNNCGSGMDDLKARLGGVLRIPGRALLAAAAVLARSTVDGQLGLMTLSWRLGAASRKPRSRVDGGVSFGPGVAPRILPVAIYDRSGRDITPAGLRWSLRKAADGWRLELPLDDAALP